MSDDNNPLKELFELVQEFDDDNASEELERLAEQVLGENRTDGEWDNPFGGPFSEDFDTDNFPVDVDEFGSWGADSGEQDSASVDFVDRENEAVIVANLPGVSPADVDVTLEDGTLFISATPEKVVDAEEDEFVQQERDTTRYSRNVELPEDVNEDAYDASLENGVLHVTFEKGETTEQTEITIE